MKTRHANTGPAAIAPKEVYNWRIWVLTLISSMGGFIFGYDLGFIGTAIELPSFKLDFGLEHATTSTKSAFSANVISLLQAGCIVGVVVAGPFNDKFGRVRALALAGIFFCVGSAIQTGSRGSEAILFTGRVIGGVGVGAASVVVPLYVSEAAPPSIRGSLVGVYEISVSAGTMIGFWINYGLQMNLPTSPTQWIVSFAVQLIPGLLLLIGLPGLPESPRWIARSKGRESCIAILQRIRNLAGDHPYVQEEVSVIMQQIDNELAEIGGDGIMAQAREIAKPGNRNRLAIGVLMFIFMQWAGSNAINYYSPAIFSSIGLTGGNSELFATGIYGVVRFVAILIAMLLVVDRYGRRKTLMAGSALMALTMWFIGSYIKIAVPLSSDTAATHITSGGYAAVVMIYVYAVGWCFSWAGIPWIIASEIYPIRIRSSCVSICVATHWVMNFVIARSTPYIITNIGFGTYFLFASFLTLSVPWVYFFVPETNAVRLEDMDQVFGAAEYCGRGKIEEGEVGEAIEVELAR